MACLSEGTVRRFLQRQMTAACQLSAIELTFALFLCFHGCAILSEQYVTDVTSIAKRSSKARYALGALRNRFAKIVNMEILLILVFITRAN